MIQRPESDNLNSAGITFAKGRQSVINLSEFSYGDGFQADDFALDIVQMPVGLKVLPVQFGVIELDSAGAASQRVTHPKTVLK